MHSLLLILAALPLTSFALVINDFRYELEASANENGTTSNMYWLQDTYEGASFFEYAEALTFFFLRALSQVKAEPPKKEAQINYYRRNLQKCCTPLERLTKG